MASHGPRCVIILRTEQFGGRERKLLTDLPIGNGVQHVIAIDETRGNVDVGSHSKISVTREACENIGLHCPIDFAWRNGDYCLYLARQQFPEADWFWMIEPDVEHSFPHLAHFFALFDPLQSVDFLTAHLRPAEAGWHWAPSAPNYRTGPWRCFFPLIRLSARAVDLCLHQRQRDRWALRSRLYWANDEAFVVNTVMQAGLETRDLNSLDVPVYADDTFGYTPLDGDATAFRSEANRLFHPVLYGDAYRARKNRIASATNSLAGRLGRKLQRHI